MLINLNLIWLIILIYNFLLYVFMMKLLFIYFGYLFLDKYLYIYCIIYLFLLIIYI